RVAAEGVEVQAILHHGPDRRPGDAGTQRGAVADPLGHGDQVGCHAPVLEAPKVRARSAETGLHLVGNAKTAVPTNDVVDDPEILRRRRHRAAHALDRLADEAGDLARGLVADQFFHVAGALHVATRVLQAIRAAVAVARRGVLDVDRRIALELPGPH